jgi:hypothetical protein
MSTYNPSIPTGGQTISATTIPIQTNFAVANTAFGVDHTAFSVLTNQGMHKQVTLQAPLAANPGQTSPIATLYTKASATTTTSDLYYQNGAATSNVVQVTGGGITAAAWCVFNSTSGSPITPIAAYNVSTISVASNVYTVNFIRPFQSSAYAVLVTPSLNISTAFAVQIGQSTGSCTLQFRVGGVLGNAGNNVSVLFLGTLA